jgi:hypothetical protein
MTNTKHPWPERSALSSNTERLQIPFGQGMERLSVTVSLIAKRRSPKILALSDLRRLGEETTIELRLARSPW